MRRSQLFLAFAMGLLVLACADADPPSVILVSVDTLRADHLGAYGYPRPTSPNLDAFARDALLFENAVAHGAATLPTVASLLTGFLPHETRILEANRLIPGVETLAERLGASGYETLAVVSNFVLQGKYGFAQGFETYDDTMDAREEARPVAERIAENTTDRAIELLDAHAGGPLFLWVHYQDPHASYSPPESYIEPFEDPTRAPRPLSANETLSGRGGIPQHQLLGDNRDYHYYVDRYDAEIRYLDEHFGRLIDAIERHGLYDEALLVFTADHGENMGEHGYFFTHGENLLRGVTHVPLILRHGKRWTGRRTDYVQHLDIVPTVLKTAGLDVDEKLRGSDLLEPTPAPREIFAESEVWGSREERVRFILRDGLKLVHRPTAKRFHLYDLSADPDEEVDLRHDARYEVPLAELQHLLLRVRSEDRLGLAPNPEPAALSAEDAAKLRALGYVE